MKTSDLAARAALFGAGGWAVENVLFGSRYSALWGGAKIPVLPVYAIGGLTAEALGPWLLEREVPWYARAAIYAAVLSGVEYAGCFFDRDVLGACSWDYSKQDRAEPLKGCIDWKHAAIWGALGLVIEKLQEAKP